MASTLERVRQLQWKFGSGVTHADVVVGGAFIVDEDGAMLPSDVEGIPLWRTLVLPRDAIEVIDVWYTTGLEGSGSNDYAVTDAFVPDEHAVYQPNALDQALRDLTTICQHIVMNSRTRITAGRVFLGLESQDLTFS